MESLGIYPIGSMYGIFTYIWLIFMVNVGKYTIHGSYGYYKSLWIQVAARNARKGYNLGGLSIFLGGTWIHRVYYTYRRVIILL